LDALLTIALNALCRSCHGPTDIEAGQIDLDLQTRCVNSIKASHDPPACSLYESGNGETPNAAGVLP